MSSQQVAPGQGTANLVLATLFLAAFVMGSAETLVVGLLNLITADLQISIAAAGSLVTAYALGLAIGGPILTALTITLNKRAIVIGALCLFVLATLVPVLTADYVLFLTVRVVAGALHGLFVAAGLVAGISVVPPERMGRAMSVIISGFAMASAVGVPLGTLLGQAVGWRGSFIAVAGLAVIALIATLALVPSVPSTGGGAAGQAKYAFAPRVLAVLFLCALVFGASAAPLTYIVPFLDRVTGISGGLISVFLLAFGVATAVGTFLGGRFADRNAGRALVIGTIGFAGSLLALYLVGTVAVLVGLAMLIWGLLVMGMAPSLQYRVVSLAGPGGALAQSLPGAAMNLGIAGGSLAGGVAIASFTVSSAVITGLITAVIAIPVALATSFLQPPVVEQPAGPTADVEQAVFVE